MHSGIDEVTFSIDGATPESYLQVPAAREFRPGDSEPPRDGRREAEGRRDLPVLNWRYILFNWNDSDEEMDGARALAAEIGIDRLSWEITDHPGERLLAAVPCLGTGDYEAIRQEIWDTSNLGNAIPGRHAQGEDRRAGPGFPTGR